MPFLPLFIVQAYHRGVPGLFLFPLVFPVVCSGRKERTMCERKQERDDLRAKFTGWLEKLPEGLQQIFAIRIIG